MCNTSWSAGCTWDGMRSPKNAVYPTCTSYSTHHDIIEGCIGDGQDTYSTASLQILYPKIFRCQKSNVLLLKLLKPPITQCFIIFPGHWLHVEGEVCLKKGYSKILFGFRWSIPIFRQTQVATLLVAYPIISPWNAWFSNYHTYPNYSWWHSDKCQDTTRYLSLIDIPILKSWYFLWLFYPYPSMDEWIPLASNRHLRPCRGWRAVSTIPPDQAATACVGPFSAGDGRGFLLGAPTETSNV